MANSEAMTSSTHSFAYSYRLVKKCFVKICETSKCHNFFIFQPIFIRFSPFCSQNFTLSSEIKLNLFRSSPLKHHWHTVNGIPLTYHRCQWITIDISPLPTPQTVKLNGALMVLPMVVYLNNWLGWVHICKWGTNETPYCSGKHLIHPKYLPQQEISHEIVEKKIFHLYDQQCIILFGGIIKNIGLSGFFKLWFTFQKSATERIESDDSDSDNSDMQHWNSSDDEDDEENPVLKVFSLRKIADVFLLRLAHILTRLNFMNFYFVLYVIYLYIIFLLLFSFLKKNLPTQRF